MSETPSSRPEISQHMVSAGDAQPTPSADIIPPEQLADLYQDLSHQHKELLGQYEAARDTGNAEALPAIHSQLSQLDAQRLRLKQSLDWRDQAQREGEAIEAATAQLAAFQDYLGQQGLSHEAIQSKLGQLETYWDESSQQAVIARPNHQAFRLDLNNCQLQGQLPLPRQLLISELDCWANQLTSLPELPASLQRLYCYSNQLTSLPELPASLQRLYCYSNQLTSLPELPASLQRLECRHNHLDAATQARLRQRGFSY